MRRRFHQPSGPISRSSRSDVPDHALAPSDWVTAKSKLWIALVVGMYAVVTYKIAGEVSMYLEPQPLPLNLVDMQVPVIPWTVWIYVSVYLIYFSSVLLQRDLARFGRFMVSYVVAYSAAMVIFIVFPTTMPRDVFPVPPGSGISGIALEFFRATDRPTNCFPSLHVASCVMSTLPFRGKRPVVFWLFCAWTLAISVACLTTKQHYLLDVVSGGMFGTVAYYFAPLAAPWMSRFGLGEHFKDSIPPAAG